MLPLLLALALATGGASSPVWSPDGTRVAYVRGASIWTAGADGSGAELRVRPVDGVSQLLWAPAEQPVFGSNFRLFVVRRARPLGAGDVAAISPDGHRLAFQNGGSCPLCRTRIGVVGVDGRGYRLLVRSVRAGDSDPSWSPDGARLAFERAPWDPRAGEYGGHRLVVQPVASGAGRPLGIVGAAPRWSPVGDELLYDDLGGGLSLVRANGTGKHRLVSTNGDRFPAAQWSPDGTRVVFTRAAGDRRRLYVVGADGTGARLLVARDFAGDDEEVPQWSPDGSRVAFTGWTAGCRTKIVYVVNADGAGLRQLTPGC
jgi:Tol biopolymer transport system component